MADSTTRNDNHISMGVLQILSKAGFSFQELMLCLIWILILIPGVMYCCCKKGIKCRNTKQRGNRETDTLLDHDGESTSRCRLAYRYCNLVECITAWMVVDLLRTPNVTKELDQVKKHEKVFLKIGSAHSFVLGRKICNTFMIFFLVLSVPFLMVGKILLGVYLQILEKISEQSGSDMNAGSEGRVKVVCYIPENSTHQINSTTWNMHCKMSKGYGDYFYSSGLFDNDNIILTSLADIAGLYSLYVVLCQIYLSIALYTCCKRCCYKRHCQTCSSICMFIVLYIVLPGISMPLEYFLLNKSLIAAISSLLPLLFIVIYSLLLAQVMTSYSLESEQQHRIVGSEDTSSQKPPICREISVSNHEESEPSSSSDDNPIEEDHYDLVTSM